MAVNNKIKWIIIHVLCHRRCHVPVRSQDLKVIGQSLCFSMSFPPLFFIYQHSGHFLKFYVYYLDWLHSRGVYRLSIAFVCFILNVGEQTQFNPAACFMCCACPKSGVKVISLSLYFFHVFCTYCCCVQARFICFTNTGIHVLLNRALQSLS